MTQEPSTPSAKLTNLQDSLHSSQDVNQNVSAKETVLKRVRSKNPSTLELNMGCKVLWGGEVYVICGIGKGMLARMYQLAEADGSGVVEHETEDEHGRIECENCAVFVDSPWEEILGSDMGLQELKIAYPCTSTTRDETTEILHLWYDGIPVDVEFDLTKNLHNQKPEFFEAMLPIVRSHCKDTVQH